MTGDELRAVEVRRQLLDVLARSAAAGDVTILEGVAILHGAGPTVEVDCEALLASWDQLSPPDRQRRLGDLARRLIAERRALASAGAPATAAAVPDWARSLALALGALVLLLVGWVAYRQWVAHRAVVTREKPLIADFDAYERERAARAFRVCEATRSRVMRGASVGPADVEGWVVELWGLRAPARGGLVGDPSLARYIAPVDGENRSRVVFAEAPALRELDGPDTGAYVVEGNVPDRGEPLFRGVRLVFTGRYVVPYFHEAQRQEYFRLARSVSADLGLDHAGLYARCAEGRSHHLGSWFHGPTPGGALASLLFFIGTSGEPADVRRSLLVPEGSVGLDAAFAFQNVARAAAPATRARVAAMIGAEAGMMVGAEGKPTTLSFPFRDSNRAARASRVIARELGIGDER